MTKAFTSALGYGITVRGYIDEDDRLVLLEPEGGGGGDSDFEIAVMTVVGSPDGLIPNMDAINVNDDSIYADLNPIPGTYNIVLYKGSQTIEISDNYTVTGSAESDPDEPGTYIVTGDFTITYSGGGE